MVLRPKPLRDKPASRSWSQSLWRNLQATSCVSIIAIFVVALAVQFPETNRYLYPLYFKYSCVTLGFPDAHMNKCGYCVGGSTKLPETYGQDCSGSCTGHEVFDCNNTCGGKAYVDECTGKCTYSAYDDVDSRNCVGLCVNGDNAASDYNKDDCGVCILGPEGTESQFKDCTKKCHLPGNVKSADYRHECGACRYMVNLTNDTCVAYECVNNTDLVCSECKMPKRDICGNCDKMHTKCFKISHLVPTHIPSNTYTEITLKGSFDDQRRNMTCIIQSLTDSNNTKANFNITGKWNIKKPNIIKCNVSLPIGRYIFGLRENKSSSEFKVQEEEIFLTSEELEVYDKTIKYTSISPTRFHYRSILNLTNTEKEIEIRFHGENVLNLPLICLVQGPIYPRWLGRKTHKSKNNHTCSIPRVWTSQYITIKPTYNGMHILGDKNFTFEFYAAAPKPSSAHISEDGIVVSVSFDRTINICGLLKCPCSDIIEKSTLDSLGLGVTCKWATKAQLLIIPSEPLQGECKINLTPVEIPVDSVSVTFKSGILKEDGQVISNAAVTDLTIEARRVREEVYFVISISGPNRIPNSGNFTIFGHHSAPSDGQPKYFWEVIRKDGGTVSSALHEATKDKNDPKTGLNLDLDCEWFEEGVKYTFELLVLTKGGMRYTKMHEIQRMSYPGPFIIAYSSFNMNLEPLRPSERLTLFFETTMPKTLGCGHRTLAYWTSNDPRVKIDQLSFMSSIYTILAYDLPEESEITFTANAFLANSSKDITTSSVQVRVGKKQFVAKIRGTGNRTIGFQMHVNASNIIMKGEAYGDTQGLALRYDWTCYAVHRNRPNLQFPCYNYNQTSVSRLLIINETERTNKVINYSAKQINTTIVEKLVFTLYVYNSSNSSIFDRDETHLLISDEKLFPQVVIEELKVRNHPIHEKNADDSYKVPAGASIVVEALIVPVPRNKFKKVLWNVTGITEPYFIATTLEKTHLLIPEGVTVGYGVYIVTLTVCNGKGTVCNSDRISLFSVPGVSNCQVSIGSYSAFEMAQAEIAGCHVPFGRSPLIYQLFSYDGNDMVALTGPQYGNLIYFVGAPSPDSILETNRTFNDSNGNIISENIIDIISFPEQNLTINLTIKVCDGLFVCTFLEPETVEVSHPNNVTESTLGLLGEAQGLAIAGNPIGALSLLAMPARYGYLPLVSQAILEYTKLAISTVPLMPGQVTLIYDCLEPFLMEKDTTVQKKVLATIAAATKIAFHLKMTPPFESLNRAYCFTSRMAANNPYDVDLLMHVSKTQDELINTVVRSAPLAQRLEFRTGNLKDSTSVLFLYHMYLNNELFYLKKNPSSRLPEITFRFSQKVREQISNRSCGQSDCHEVSIVFILYPGQSLHPEGSVGRRMSPVLSVKIFSPFTGEEIAIHEKDGLEMHFLKTGNAGNATRLPGMITRCHKWDGTTWSMDAVQTLGESEGRVHCVASDSGLFAALEVKIGLSGGAIAGIIVASLMFVTIMGMVVIFFMRLKKEAKNQAKISQQELARSEDDAFSISP